MYGAKVILSWLNICTHTQRDPTDSAVSEREPFVQDSSNTAGIIISKKCTPCHTSQLKVKPNLNQQQLKNRSKVSYTLENSYNDCLSSVEPLVGLYEST